MYESDDECTVFEPTPLGARQRLIPSKTFVAKARAAAAARACEAELPAELPRPPASVETAPFARQSARSVPTPFATSRAAMPPVSFEPSPVALPCAPQPAGFEPPPMRMQVATPILLPAPLAVPLADASSSYATVPRRRGVRRLAVALLFGSVAIVALAGAGAVESEPSQGPTIQLGARVYDEPVNAVASRTTATEPLPPPDEVVEAAPMAPKPTKRAAPAQRRRAVKVDASSALGTLRPKSW